MAIEGYVLGFDFGLKFIGLAVGQTVTKTAGGLKTLKSPQRQTQLGRNNFYPPRIQTRRDCCRPAVKHG